MDPALASKLRILADAAKYDASCASSGAPKRTARPGWPRLDHGSGHLPRLHAGWPLRLAAEDPADQLLPVRLRLLHQPALVECARARASRVDEVVTLTLDFYKRNYIEGLFLSSGIIRSPDHTMEQMMRVAKTLRREHGFAGYIHLKTIPEASPWLIEQAGLWADRLSINLELPSAQSLEQLAPEKNAGTIASAMGQMRERIAEAQGRAAPLLARRPEHADDRRRRRHHRRRRCCTPAPRLYQTTTSCSRVYYSAFSPIPEASRCCR